MRVDGAAICEDDYRGGFDETDESAGDSADLSERYG
jgi:hypothetical protein